MGYRAKYKKNELGDTELNLVPMLDLFLSLIPFLLVSAVFLNYGGLKVEAPSFAQNQQATPETKPSDALLQNQEIELALRLDQGHVKFVGYTKGFKSKMPGVEAQFNLSDKAGIKSYLADLLTKHPKINSVLFNASLTSKYEEAVSVINFVRAAKVSDNVVLAVRSIE